MLLILEDQIFHFTSCSFLNSFPPTLHYFIIFMPILEQSLAILVSLLVVHVGVNPLALLGGVTSVTVGGQHRVTVDTIEGAPGPVGSSPPLWLRPFRGTVWESRSHQGAIPN